MGYIEGSCCPACGARLVNTGGCDMCPLCGWSRCGKAVMGEGVMRDAGRDFSASVEKEWR